MKRLLLFLKGVCMGAADVIPGVSGGTMALILGIYKRLVDAIEGLHVRWVPPLGRWIVSGGEQEHWEAFRDELASIDLAFLVTLGVGIVAAIIGGSMVIPPLMEQFPVVMRAFFFGLIAASVWVPFRMLDVAGRGELVAALVVGVVLALAGFLVTDPGGGVQPSQEWQVVESEGESLERITRRGPSAAATAIVYWAPENEQLRRAIGQASPEKAEELRRIRSDAKNAAGSLNREELKKLSEPFQKLRVPAGTPVKIPRPAYWYVFLAGAVAICAMILPGISGSYILLILGAYFFVLNAIKGSIELVLEGMVPWVPVGVVGVFGVGATIGLLSFARLLSYLLEEHPTPTLAGLVGLMVGCLRGIWPFRRHVGGEPTNVWPAALDGTVAAAATATVVGVAVVAALTWGGGQVEDPGEAV